MSTDPPPREAPRIEDPFSPPPSPPSITSPLPDETRPLKEAGHPPVVSVPSSPPPSPTSFPLSAESPGVKSFGARSPSLDAAGADEAEAAPHFLSDAVKKQPSVPPKGKKPSFFSKLMCRGGGAGAIRERQIAEAAIEDKLNAVKAREELLLIREVEKALAKTQREIGERRRELFEAERELDDMVTAAKQTQAEQAAEVSKAQKEVEVADEEKRAITLEIKELTEKAADQRAEQARTEFEKKKEKERELAEFSEKVQTDIKNEINSEREKQKEQVQKGREEVMEMQNKIKLQKEKFLSTVTELDASRESLLRLKSTLKREDEEKDQETAKMEALQRAHSALRRSSQQAETELAKKLQEAMAAKKRRKKKSDQHELRIETIQSNCPGFAIVGRDIDTWLDETKENVRLCIANFRGENLPHKKMQISNRGALCQMCFCAMGADHDEKSCPVCKILDLSDSSLFP